MVRGHWSPALPPSLGGERVGGVEGRWRVGWVEGVIKAPSLMPQPLVLNFSKKKIKKFCPRFKYLLHPPDFPVVIKTPSYPRVVLSYPRVAPSCSRVYQVLPEDYHYTYH